MRRVVRWDRQQDEKPPRCIEVPDHLADWWSAVMRLPATPQVLIVEPDAALQSAVATWLEGAGYDCMPVSDPDEALAIAEDDEADVALVSSPVAAWSTSHLALALQARDADLPVIVVRTATELRRGGLRGRAGSLEEIPAPLTRGTVMHAVERALEWREWTVADRVRYLDIERSVAGQAALVRDACLSEPCSPDGLVASLVAFVERRMPGSSVEARRVRLLSLALGTAIGLEGARLAALGHAASLQGLGQALLPASLRQHGAVLSGIDTALARRLPEIVYELLAHVPSLRNAAELVYASQERFDGKGHPRGLGGLEIPMGARIIGLARAVDALGCGSDAVTPVAGADLTKRAGVEFDPDLVRVWLRLAERPAASALH
jgi:response regulator RpfG family c-di-GMP phosphodiesterase